MPTQSELINKDKTSLQALFPTMIYLSQINRQAEINAPVKDAIMKMKQECEEKGLKCPEDYYNSWTSYFFPQYNLVSDQRFETIMKFVKFSIENFAHSLGYDLNKKHLRITTLWANVQYQGGAHRKHIHSGSQFSGVYYVEAPENSGKLKLSDPKEAFRMIEPPPDNSTQFNALEVDIAPESGRIVVFPSYLQHEVVNHPGKDMRISMSFNAVFEDGWDD